LRSFGESCSLLVVDNFMEMKRFLAFFISLGLSISSIDAQITLSNPSFEGEPIDATVPKGWLPCKEGTTPDILPGFWGVYNEPADGRSYMGLITREDGTWESVGQKLEAPLEKGGCYTFTCELAHSNTYAGYNIPLKLRIWGSATPCGKQELLAETKTI
jgi:hypothetical protein